MERPTWSNYAIGDEAERPHLWRGCQAAYCPSLGPTGLKLFDVSGKGRHLNVTGLTADLSWPISSGQHSLNLNEGAENDNVTYASVWNTGLGDATVCAWIYSRETGSSKVIIDNGDTNSFRMFSSNTSIGGGFYTSGSPFGSFGTIALNTWNHVAIRRVGAVSRTWINGSNATSSDYTSVSTVTAGGATLAIGSTTAGTQWWDGMVDDVRIYDRPLSESEIRELAEYRGVAYQPRRRRASYFYQTDTGVTITGTAAVTLDSHISTASGSGGTASNGFNLASTLSINLSDSLSVG